MKIRGIKLENIRSHTRSHISFQDGFNCLVGGLGTGKSSILFAVDFALFGEPIGRSYDYMLREGTDTARVALSFVQNGREYTIQRVLKRHNDRISQDMEYLKLFEGERLIAEMKSDAVAEQLQSVTGIDREIFREIVWVQQEHLKDILNMPPSERQRRLDQLFGLADYETSWANLRPILRWYESERSVLERDPDIIGIQELRVRHEETVGELTAKESEIEETRVQLLAAERSFEEASSRLQQLESVREKNEELQRNESELQVKIASVKESTRRFTEEIDVRKAKNQELTERLSLLKTQEDSYRQSLKDVGLPSSLTIEQLKENVKILEEKISSKLGEGESLRNEIRRSTQRISNLAKENICPLCLQVLSPGYKEGLMTRLYQQSTHDSQQLKDLEKTMGELERGRNVISSVVSNLQTIRTRMEEVSRQMESERVLLATAQKRVQEKQLEGDLLQSEIDTLRMKMKEFNIAEFEEAQRLRTATFELFSSLKYKVQSIESQRNEILKRLETLKERIDNAQKKAARMDKVKKIIELTQEIRQAYQSIRPKLRGEFITYLERVVQQVLGELTGLEGPLISVKIDENYTPVIESEGGYERSTTNLSGGERTLLAFAYRLGVGQLIMQWRVGHGLRMLLLDEPTESLGREDGSIDRLAESLSRLKTVEQIVAVTHSEAFAEKADHVIRLEKRDNQSVTSIEQ